MPEHTASGGSKFTEFPVPLQGLFQDKRFVPINAPPAWFLNRFVRKLSESETQTPLWLSKGLAVSSRTQLPPAGHSSVELNGLNPLPGTVALGMRAQCQVPACPVCVPAGTRGGSAA